MYPLFVAFHTQLHPSTRALLSPRNNIDDDTCIRAYLSLSLPLFISAFSRLALDPVPSNRARRGAANLFYSDPRNGRVSHGAARATTSFRNVLSGNRIDSCRREKKAKDLFVTSCRAISEITGFVCCPTFILSAISIIESIQDLVGAGSNDPVLSARDTRSQCIYTPRVTIRRQVVSRSGGESGNHGRRDARRFQASPLVGATLRYAAG